MGLLLGLHISEGDVRLGPQPPNVVLELALWVSFIGELSRNWGSRAPPEL